MAIKTGKIFYLLLVISTVIFACGTPYGIYHTVKKGQTLYRISKAYNVPVEEIIKANNIDDPSSLKVGERIFIPGVDKGIDVEPYYGEMTKEEVHESPKEEDKPKRKHKDDYVRDIPSSSGFIWPVKGKIFSLFENSRTKRHDGIDISAPEGTPIRASAAGKVIYSGSGIRGYGNIIIIKHANNYFTVYAHNKENHVLEGNFVKQGQIIGRVGDTGRASGPHLHFEIRKGKTAVNPLKFLQ